MNTGHGHVFPREDGVKARCGGPGMCKECAKDLTRQKMLEGERPVMMVKVQMSHEELEAISQPIVDTINTLFTDGRFTIDQVLLAAAYTLGLALAERGVALTETQQIGDALPPLMRGYHDMKRAKLPRA